MTIAIARVQPVHLMNAEHHVAAGPQTKSTNLGHESTVDKHHTIYCY